MIEYGLLHGKTARNDGVVVPCFLNTTPSVCDFCTIVCFAMDLLKGLLVSNNSQPPTHVSTPRSLWFYYALMVLVIVLDQITKFAIEARYAFHEFEPITSFFNLGLTYNPGAAFSFLADHNGWQKWLFTALAIGASIFLVMQIRANREKTLQNIGFAMIAGGALGNMIDRLRIGMVVDFLDFHWQGVHWPAFNIADSAIFIGVFLVIWQEFSRKK